MIVLFGIGCIVIKPLPELVDAETADEILAFIRNNEVDKFWSNSLMICSLTSRGSLRLSSFHSTNRMDCKQDKTIFALEIIFNLNDLEIDGYKLQFTNQSQLKFSFLQHSISLDKLISIMISMTVCVDLICL